MSQGSLPKRIHKLPRWARSGSRTFLAGLMFTLAAPADRLSFAKLLSGMPEEQSAWLIGVQSSGSIFSGFVHGKRIA